MLKKISIITLASLLLTLPSLYAVAQDSIPRAEVLAAKMLEAQSPAEMAAYGDTLKSLGFDFVHEEQEDYTRNYALALKEERRYDEAVSLLLAYIDETPNSPCMAAILADVYSATGSKRKAHKYYEYAMALDPLFINPYCRDAEIYAAEHQYDKALRLYLFAMDNYGFDHDYDYMLLVANKIMKMTEECPRLPKTLSSIVQAFCNKRLGNYQEYLRLRRKMSQEMRAELDILCAKGYGTYMFILNRQLEKAKE